MSPQFTPRQTLLHILVPMIVTFATTRLYLHVVGVTHIYPAGYLFHHLFTGVLLVIPAAFALAFDGPRGRTGRWTLAVLGVGSALILDEIAFLVATQASDSDYLSPISMWGGVVCVMAAAALLFALYRKQQGSRPDSEQ